MRIRLTLRPWTRCRPCWTPPAPATRSCCAPRMAPPWSLRIQDEAALTVVAMARGSSVWERAGETFLVGTGDVVLLTGPTPYVVADEAGGRRSRSCSPATAPSHPPDEPPVGAADPGHPPLGQQRRRSGRDAGRQLRRGGRGGNRLLAVLPDTVVLRAAEWRSPLVPLLLDEMAREEVGQASLLDRLLDALVVSAVRQWALSRGDAAPAWLDAHPTRSSPRRCALMHDRRVSPGPWSRWPARSGCRGRRWPGGSASGWASRRWPT